MAGHRQVISHISKGSQNIYTILLLPLLTARAAARGKAHVHVFLPGHLLWHARPAVAPPLSSLTILFYLQCKICVNFQLTFSDFQSGSLLTYMYHYHMTLNSLNVLPLSHYIKLVTFVVGILSFCTSETCHV